MASQAGSDASSDTYGSETVIPFSPTARADSLDSIDQLDKAGQTILRLLQKAAGVAEANSQQALEMAQKLSHQLRAAEDRIAELEVEALSYQERAERAEQWLHKIYTEVEERFIKRPAEKRRNVYGAPTGRGG
jgi:TolA-binding protein